ncbi:MAG: hypothetical protein JSU69_02320, partial [Candidatus Zixiibacteriota bacterium]
RGFMGVQEERFLPLDKTVIELYDKQWRNMLARRFDEDEALRYEILRPFREFVMKNYRIVRTFGIHVLFQLKDSVSDRQAQ